MLVEQVARDFVRTNYCNVHCRNNDGCANDEKSICTYRDLYAEFFSEGVEFQKKNIEMSIKNFERIIGQCDVLTSGNASLQAAIIKGTALRMIEYLNKYK